MTEISSVNDARRPRLGVALGSGSARGLAHIGVLQSLDEHGIRPDVVCGTSIGAFVGAAYVTGHLSRLDEWARQLSTLDVVGLFDVALGKGGVLTGRRAMEVLGEARQASLESLDPRLALVATDLGSGREVWITDGVLEDGVRASAALPGLVSPVERNGRWLVDGGLVNPVPVSVCRAMGAEVVLAVQLHAERIPLELPLRRSDKAPSYFEVIGTSLHIMQDRITRSRMAGDPPDVTVAPRLPGVRLLDFDEASRTIDQGRASMDDAMESLREALGDRPAPAD